MEKLHIPDASCFVSTGTNPLTRAVNHGLSVKARHALNDPLVGEALLGAYLDSIKDTDPDESLARQYGECAIELLQKKQRTRENGVMIRSGLRGPEGPVLPARDVLGAITSRVISVLSGAEKMPVDARRAEIDQSNLFPARKRRADPKQPVSSGNALRLRDSSSTPRPNDSSERRLPSRLEAAVNSLQQRHADTDVTFGALFGTSEGTSKDLEAARTELVGIFGKATEVDKKFPKNYKIIFGKLLSDRSSRNPIGELRKFLHDSGVKRHRVDDVISQAVQYLCSVDYLSENK